jgi:hypothetical protein
MTGALGSQDGPKECEEGGVCRLPSLFLDGGIASVVLATRLHPLASESINEDKVSFDGNR